MSDNEQAAEATQAKDSWVMVDTPEGKQQPEEPAPAETTEGCVHTYYICDFDVSL